MMSVTTLRNLKKLLIQFLHEKKQKDEELLRDLIENRDKPAVARAVTKKYNLPVSSDEITVDDSGRVTVSFYPDVEEVARLKVDVSLLDEVYKEFESNVKLVERYFTLAEASSILHIPEMPEKIKKWLDEMVETLK